MIHVFLAFQIEFCPWVLPTAPTMHKTFDSLRQRNMSTKYFVCHIYWSCIYSSPAPSSVNPGGVLGSWGQDPTNFFPCPGPHIGGPRLNFHKI